MSDTGAGLLAELRRRRLVAIVRGNDPDAVVRCVVALVEEGVRLVEVSLTGRGAVDALRTAVIEVGDAVRVAREPCCRTTTPAGPSAPARVSP